MSIDIKVPVLPESVQDATIAAWHKQAGHFVARDENLVDIETDKVVLEVVAPADGVLETITRGEGETVIAEEVIGVFKEGASAGSQTEAKPESQPTEQLSSKDPGPSARRAAQEHGVDTNSLTGSGQGGRVTKQDVTTAAANTTNTNNTSSSNNTAQKQVEESGIRSERRVPMTRLRARISQRLLSAQHDAAILTTFNEINMQPSIELRAKYKDKFEKVHGVRLGYMSFFTRAVVGALKKFPEVNASIDGGDIVYHEYIDIGIAVSSPRGLVVPILRNAENMGMAEIEKQIRGYGEKASIGKLTIEEMTGGTFTISNGGVFGSLMSTPILNPPQSAILGMHKIEDRAVVENGQIVVRPMMYVALSYDHRIIDGSESVRFLVSIKEALEDPARLILEV
ncbi:MAG: 2-oxoglutarate dehydrogenase complex dihydrolipoyllysine-residue succinyltransferase [Francisellaceae bacterium]|nr:2-oxoglutarate dehydrogenase complex dihydrolipoyllysine-residue succinyltransferase [Francisellaceae bacterium]